MAIAALFDIPGGTQAQYDEITNELSGGRGLHSLSDWPVEGILFHVAGFTESGLRVLDVWESEEAMQAFLASRVAPLGIPEPTRVEMTPVHNFLRTA